MMNLAPDRFYKSRGVLILQDGCRMKFTRYTYETLEKVYSIGIFPGGERKYQVNYGTWSRIGQHRIFREIENYFKLGEEGK